MRPGLFLVPAVRHEPDLQLRSEGLEGFACPMESGEAKGQTDLGLEHTGQTGVHFVGFHLVLLPIGAENGLEKRGKWGKSIFYKNFFQDFSLIIIVGYFKICYNKCAPPGFYRTTLWGSPKATKGGMEEEWMIPPEARSTN
jgi:hypothetical protein